MRAPAAAAACTRGGGVGDCQQSLLTKSLRAPRCPNERHWQDSHITSRRRTRVAADNYGAEGTADKAMRTLRSGQGSDLRGWGWVGGLVCCPCMHPIYCASGFWWAPPRNCAETSSRDLYILARLIATCSWVVSQEVTRLTSSHSATVGGAPRPALHSRSTSAIIPSAGSGGTYLLMPHGECYENKKQGPPCLSAHPKAGVRQLNYVTGASPSHALQHPH